MALTIYFIIAWFIIIIICLLPRKLSFVENSFIFLFLSIVIKNSFTVFGLNLKWIEANMEPEFFLAYLLYRTIIYPCALLFMVTILYTYRKTVIRVTAILSVSIFILLVENLGQWLDVYTYTQWNNWYTIIEIAVFSILAIFISKLIIHSSKRTKNYESI
ncbi:hypothetical protein ACFYKX_05335 [Cytobacillus sp. FJAT-54145]|uniref:Uncharacterized protein n=1 Tax=Cytobacillus spartinae TaxID=3299023 RepID=A0ABW6K781_9BACI